MNIFERITEKYRVIIKELGTDFREQDKKEVLELSEHNECGIAFETLCTQLYEFDVYLSQSTYDKIKSLGEELHMDSSNWEDLEEINKTIKFNLLY